MATINFKGNPIHTSGELPAVGTSYIDVAMTGGDLTDKNISSFEGKNIVLNIFPSVNTGICAQSVRTFNEKMSALPETTVICVSKDLPFAQGQFCAAEGLENVVMMSDFRTDFGAKYGVTIEEGPMKGLLSRAVVVINKEGNVVYTEQVPEIAQEPNYEAAINSLK